MTNLIVRGNQAFWGSHSFDCSIGKGGLVLDKIEGDGGTPIGQYPFRKLFYRPDRIHNVETVLPVQSLTESDGWCDDPLDQFYNQHITLPYPARHEKLWRADHLYDLILVVGHNDSPPVPGKGSAIFVHLRRPEGTPTEGCVAFSQENLLHILKECTLSSRLIVER